MKKIIIIRSSGNELANQLWNYVSIYAYSLEKNYSLLNPSFFEYGEYFTMKSKLNIIFRIFFFKPFKKYTKRKTALKRRIWRKLYAWYSNVILLLCKNKIFSTDNEIFYLPPTKESSERLMRLEDGQNNIYFDGWLFRNTIGLEKYRLNIKEYFKPRQNIKTLVESTIKDIREQYEKILGVHIRQGDYKTWRNGDYFIGQKKVREIIDEYILRFNIDKNITCFLITSDETVKTEIFSGLNIIISKNNAVTDLFLLASTDTIIGSNSTFGAFASYYGNIAFIVMQKKDVDWEYYKYKTKYFENKYATFVQY